MSELLEKAKAVQASKRGKNSNLVPYDPDLAIAWATGQISYGQAVSALGLKNSNAGRFYGWLCMSLRLAIQDGSLQIKGGDWVK